MNRAYSLVWSDRLQCYAVASETTRRRGKSAGLKPLAAALLSTFSLSAYALPEGGQVSAGSGTIATAGTTTTITQGSQNMAINWQRFGTAAGESIVFQQPNTSAIALNRVTGNESSTFLGSLSANGQVWVLNPNGVMFGAGSQVSVGGLLATTLQLSDDDFISGKRSFSGTGAGGLVTNRGNITTADGGYVALLGGQVSNEGIITARLGTVALAAGNRMTLDFSGDKLLNVQVEEGTLDALAQNKQIISANGGTVLLTAIGADALFNAVVNNEGLVEARTVGNNKGKITLLSDMRGGTTTVAFTLDASPVLSSGEGGIIETSGRHVQIVDNTLIRTNTFFGKIGEWRINSNDFTIAASGGDISGATLGSNLNRNNVTINTVNQGTLGGNGDIHVNDAVSWSGNTKLSLNAQRNVNINADITATGKSAGLSMTPGTGGSYALRWGSAITLSGDNATLDIAGQGYTLIRDVAALQAMKDNLGGHYALGTDVDASATSSWNNGAGFSPVRSDTAMFTGVLDGLGHSVNNLYIYSPQLLYGTGLIGNNKGIMRNLGIVDADITGGTYVGAVAGQNIGSINQVYVSGKVSTNDRIIGGLVGNNSGEITNAYSTANVAGKIGVGGLVGTNNGIIKNVFATGAVSGEQVVGGLVGGNYESLSNAYASGTVTASGMDSIGGLAGYNQGTINQTYATGTVTSQSNGTMGALIGIGNGIINNSYASGTVNGTAADSSNLFNSISNGITTNTSALDSTQAKQQASYAGFDFDNVWRIYEGNTTPLLRSLLVPLTVTASNSSKTYDGQAYSGGYSYTSSNTTAALSGSATYATYSGTATVQDVVNAGSYIIKPGGLYSDRYDISYVDGSLTVNQAPLTVTANNQSKTYGQTLSFSGQEFSKSGLVPGETIGTVQLASAGSSATANVADSPYLITASAASGGTFNPSNYTISYVNGNLTVTKALLSITANNATRTYNGTAFTGGNGVTYTGLVNGDTVTGTPVYGGISQGAVNAGTYAITLAGLSASPNYTVSYANGSLFINPKLLTVSIINTPTKVYEGNASANLTPSNYSIAGLVGTNKITINQTYGSYNSQHVSLANRVEAKLGADNIVAAAGTLASNYLLPTLAFGAGRITPATLTYLADLRTLSFGSSIPLLTGTLTGFVNGDNLWNATTGTAVWKTAATSKSLPGKYAINGSGLTANYGDYKFVQAASNATALTITCPTKTCK